MEGPRPDAMVARMREISRPLPRLAAIALAGFAAILPGAVRAAEAPPAPAPGLDYRALFRQGPEGRAIEIRRRGSAYLHRLPDVTPPAVIHYDLPSGIATIFDGPNVMRLALGPSEIGGFDAIAMMSGLSETPVTWEAGAERTVAGTRCTEHLGTGSRDGAAVTGRFCVTTRGIVLSIRTGGPGRIGHALEAETLEIGPQPAEPFDMTPFLDLEIGEWGVIR